MRTVGALLATAAVAVAATNPSCFDDNGDAVSWFTAIKDNNGGAYAIATSEDNSLEHSQYNLQDPSGGGVSKTVAQLWDTSFSRGAFNDEPGYKASSKYGHTKGFVLAGDTAGIYMVHSIPNWPIVDGPSYTGLPDNETKFAQSMLCFTLSLSDLNATVGHAMQQNRPAVYVNSLLPAHAGVLNGLQAALNGVYQNFDSSTASPVTSIGSSTTMTVFSKTAKWGQDLYFGLVAPTLKADLWVETWIRGGAVGPSCSGPFTVLDVNGVIFDGVSWKETQDHSKWAVTTPDSGSKTVCIGDINRMTSQYKRGGGTVCFSNDGVWAAFSKAVTDHDSCDAKASLRGAAA